MSDKPDTFTCAICGNVYEKEWSDSEADEECERLFGISNATSRIGDTEDDCAYVCDDCFQMIRPDRKIGSA